MKTVVGPASDLLFAVGSEVDPDNGASAAAVPAARWTAAAEAAGRLHAASLLLLEPNTVRPGSWTTDAQHMASLSERAAAAARSRDGKTLTQAANDLGDTCTACHGKYKPQS